MTGSLDEISLDGPAAGDAEEVAVPDALACNEPVAPLRMVLGCVLAWAVPGAGHMVLGRWGRGLLFGSLVLALLVGGIALEGKVYKPIPGEPLTYLAALGAAGVGIPFAIAHAIGWADGNLEGAYFEYGNTFTLVAGLLNLLVVLDAFDVAIGRR